jgi:hypothetical protein
VARGSLVRQCFDFRVEDFDGLDDEFATKCAQSCTLLFAFPAEDLADRLGPEDVVAPGKMYSSDLPADSDEDPI